MGGGRIIPKEWERPVGIVLYLGIGCFGLFILALWVALLLGFMKILPSFGVSDPPTALFVFALSVAVMCTVIWAGAQIQVLKISEQTETRIWRTLIAASLTALVGGLVKWIK